MRYSVLVNQPLAFGSDSLNLNLVNAAPKETRKQIVTRFAPLLRAAEKLTDPTEHTRLLVERARLLGPAPTCAQGTCLSDVTRGEYCSYHYEQISNTVGT